MRKFLFSVAVLALMLVTGGTASAQWGGTNKNVIVNSGNGVGNVISVRNGGGFNPYVGYPFAGGGRTNINRVIDSGNGVGNVIDIRNRGGFGGVNVNKISGSGNGVGNVIRIGNR